MEKTCGNCVYILYDDIDKIVEAADKWEVRKGD